MIKHVLLDLDDTILDFHAAERIALGETFVAVGIEPSEEIMARYSAINIEGWQMLERGEIDRREVLHRRFRILFAELGVKVSEELAQSIYEYRLSLSYPFMEGGRELLDALRGKYELYIVSNGTAVVQDRRIKDSEIGEYFLGIFISQRVGFDKPRREFFDYCFAEIEDFDPKAAIIIGDSLTSDIKGGLDAGILTCHFNPKSKPNNTGIKPHYTVTSLGEIPDLLESL